MTTPQQFDDRVPPTSAGDSSPRGMRVADAMTRDVRIANPGQTIEQAAGMMADIDAGALPVGEDDRLVGMITDRDIAIRAVARGKGPATLVKDVMTEDVRYCFEDEDTAHVIRNMAGQQLRRLPVLDRNKRLVGMLSLGDLATHEAPRPVGEGLAGISSSGGAHSQGTPH